MSAPTTPRCPACDAPLAESDRFCERCGAKLADEGSTDRIERDLLRAAAVSDRGLVHHRNEDAFFLEIVGDRNVAAVVCDGISTASASDVAARDAARAAGEVLVGAAGDPARDGTTATEEAIGAATGAVAQVQWTTRTRRVDPSCTLVSALCRGDEIVVGWRGDSRAYWIDDGGPRQITTDETLAEESVAQGLITPEEAARSPYLHSVTNWVGPDAPDRPPRVATVRPERPGRLLLCTDGLWNYLTTADALGDLLGALPAGASAAGVARSLADAAVGRGGRDNITVAVIDFDPT